MKTRNVVWWGLFLVTGVCLQALLPGLDVLVIGLILALQERNPVQVAWVMGVFIFVQEGVGTLDFGSTLLWYMTVVFLFFMGRWLFETENFLFVFLLSACIGAGHFVMMKLMCVLQYIPVNETTLMDECILQALFIPFAWRFAILTRRWVVLHEDSA